jgi:hypothetical protein
MSQVSKPCVPSFPTPGYELARALMQNKNPSDDAETASSVNHGRGEGSHICVAVDDYRIEEGLEMRGFEGLGRALESSERWNGITSSQGG